MAQYKDVEMPDGSIVEFPSSMSQEAIDGVIKKKFGNKVKFEKPKSLKDKVLQYGIKNPLAGTAKTFEKIQNLPLKALSGLNKEFGEAAKKYSDINYDEAFGLPEQKNWGDVLSQMPAELVMAAALPGANLGRFGQLIGNIPKGGKYLQKIMSEALPQMGLSAVLSDPDHAADSALMAGVMTAPFSAASQLAISPKPQVQRLGANLAGMLGGGLTTYGLEEMGAPHSVSAGLGLAAGLSGRKLAGTKAMMMDELAGGVDPNMVAQKLKSAQRLGLDFITPSEAGSNPALAEAQGRYGRTPTGSSLSYDKAHQRVASEERAINKVLDIIYNPTEMEGKIAEAYKRVEGKKISPELVQELGNDEIIKHIQQTLENTPVYKQGMKGLPQEEAITHYSPRMQNYLETELGLEFPGGTVAKDTIGYWNNVKKILDDQYAKAEAKGQSTQAHYIDETRRKLLNKLDEVHPDYADARYLSEREQTRNKLENVFDRSDIRSGANFYKALNSKKKFDELMHNLRDVPEARKMLKDMRLLFKDFSNPPSVKSSLGASRMGMRQHRNAIPELKEVLGNMFVNDKFDVDAINFVTSKDWNKQVADINKISDKQKKAAKTIEFFGKIAAQANARKEQEDIR